MDRPRRNQRLSSLWLPTGGHVEPGEHAANTVWRENPGRVRLRCRLPSVEVSIPRSSTIRERADPVQLGAYVLVPG